jgi:hypothetical protein
MKKWKAGWTNNIKWKWNKLWEIGKQSWEMFNKKLEMSKVRTTSLNLTSKNIYKSDNT